MPKAPVEKPCRKEMWVLESEQPGFKSQLYPLQNRGYNTFQ